MIFLFWHHHRRCGRRKWSAGTWIAFVILCLAGTGVSMTLLVWAIWILLAAGAAATVAGLVRRAMAAYPAPRAARETADTQPLNPRLHHSDRR
jgi:hypothetical protein